MVRIVEWSPVGKKLRERPRNRRRDEVLKDIRVISLKKWTKLVKGRLTWHDPVKKSKTRAGL